MIGHAVIGIVLIVPGFTIGAQDILAKIVGGMLHNTVRASHVTKESPILRISGGQPSLEWTQELDKLVSGALNSSENLESIPLDIHVEVSFLACTVTHKFIPRQHGTDVFTVVATECK